MKRWGVWVIVILLFFTTVLGSWLRVDRYIVALLSIIDLPRPLWSQAYEQMSAVAGGERGILARAMGTGMWLWQGGRVAYIPVEYDTVYSYWQACEGRDTTLPLPVRGEQSIERVVAGDIAGWQQMVRAGDVVEIYRGDGVVREIYGYDWRLYLPLPASLETQCRY
jgi:hypothetical protein